MIGTSGGSTSSTYGIHLRDAVPALESGLMAAAPAALDRFRRFAGPIHLALPPTGEFTNHLLERVGRDHTVHVRQVRKLAAIDAHAVVDAATAAPGTPDDPIVRHIRPLHER